MNQTTSRYPRATRDDCTRSADVLQGPYRRRPAWLAWYDETDPADRLVLAVCIVGFAAVICMGLVGWMAQP